MDTGLVLLLGGTLATIIYFLPSIIAKSRRKTNVLAIFALNLLLGWILIGWVLALVWALAHDPYAHGQTPNPNPS